MEEIDKNFIEEIEKLGFREYTPGSLEEYDRAWQFKISDSCHININWYRPIKECVFMPEVVYYRDHEKYAKQDKYYSFHKIEDIIECVKDLKLSHGRSLYHSKSK